MESYRQAVGVLPEPLRARALAVDEPIMARTEEVRLRAGRVPTLVLPEGERPIFGTVPVDAALLDRVVELASRWSVHTVLEQLRRGYLTVTGGHRLGLCGTVVMEGGTIHALRELSGANLRVARQIKGVAGQTAVRLCREGQLPNTLILAAPGAGKTTLLRDLVRCVSSGEVGPPLRVAVADERGELAALWHGQACMDLGPHTDVLDGCPKALAIPMLLRGMNPQVIAVDEITVREDILAMEQAVGCGVTLLATAHGGGPEDLKRRALYREMTEKGMFQMLVTIRVENGRRMIQTDAMERFLC